MRLMPRERREAMYALYRYCRALDDIADGPGDPHDKLAELETWHGGLRSLFAGEECDIADIAALAGPMRRFQLEQGPLDAIIRGMEMDVRGEMQAPSLDRLRDYCYCVAGAVGLSSLPIFGADRHSSGFALALGEALQLTNILRDLREDVARSRLYIPREFLDRANVAAHQPDAVLDDPGVDQACDLLAETAAQRYREAVAALPPDPHPLRPAMIMMGIYSRLLEQLRSRGWRATERARVPPATRLWIALRHLGPPSTWPSFT